MATWSSRRKFRYAAGVVLFLVIFIGTPLFLFFYEKPTCFDGKKNGDELDTDCGGSCTRLCQSAFLPPRIEWGGAKFENVGPNLYNVAAYIINPNVNGGAVDVPYKFTLYDSGGQIITERSGKLNLYPHRNTLAFQGLVKAEDRIPTKATFEFTKSPEWFKSDDKLGNISIISKEYKEIDGNSSLEVGLENKGLIKYDDIIVGVVLYDGSGNVIGFSQTKIDSIAAKNGKETAPFTWPINRGGKVISEEVILGTEPVSSDN